MGGRTSCGGEGARRSRSTAPLSLRPTRRNAHCRISGHRGPHRTSEELGQPFRKEQAHLPISNIPPYGRAIGHFASRWTSRVAIDCVDSASRSATMAIMDLPIATTCVPLVIVGGSDALAEHRRRTKDWLSCRGSFPVPDVHIANPRLARATWHALNRLAKDRMETIQELAETHANTAARLGFKTATRSRWSSS